MNKYEETWTMTIREARKRLDRLPQWWREKEALNRVNDLTGAYNDLDHADAYLKQGLHEDMVAKVARVIEYVEIVEEKIADWASDVEVY